MPEPLPLIKGTLDLLVLRALAGGTMHGFEITTWLEKQSGGLLGVEDSALYQALYRLEERAFIEAEWGVTENNRKARYYRLRPTGRAHLEAETEQWLRYSQTLTGVLSSNPRRA